MCEHMEAKESEVKEYSELDKYAYVSIRAFESKEIGYCYREWSDIKIDSGWRFMLGDEDEDFAENPDNILTMDLKDVVAWKPELHPILATRANCDFEWNEATNQFEKI